MFHVIRYWMGTQAAENWILLANFVAVGVYVCLTRGIKSASNKQVEASQDLAKWQREQWQLDSRKQEWMELIGTLTRCAQEIINARSNVKELRYVWTKHVNPAPNQGDRVIADRLFIAEIIEQKSIQREWDEFKDLSKRRTATEQSLVELAGHLRDSWAALHQKILKLAKEDLQLSSGTRV